MSTALRTRDRGTDVGTLIRNWRQRRRLSQLELASRAEVSSRHLSFVETGRARPSPEMIVRLSEHLEVPLRERNSLLVAGGYAPRYPDTAPADLGPVLASFRSLLDAHAPYPALLLDRYWDVVDANDAVPPLLAGAAASLVEPPVNVIRLSLHPDGLAPRIVNRAQWRTHLLHQLRARAERTGDPRLAELYTEVSAYSVPGDPDPASDEGGTVALDEPVAPVVTLVLRPLDESGPTLRFFSVASRVESPGDVTVDELHLETFLPADTVTATALGPRR